MPILPIIEGQLIVSVSGNQITIDQVTEGVVSGVITRSLFSSALGDPAGALTILQNAIFQAK